MATKTKNPIFKSRMYATAFICFMAVAIPAPVFYEGVFGKPTLLVIIPILGISYFWFAFAIRVFYIYEDGVKIFFPLRFKPLYKKREIFIPYSEMAKINFYNLHFYEHIQIVLLPKCIFLGFKIKKKFSLWLDAKLEKRNAIMRFLIEKGVKIVVRPSWEKFDGFGLHKTR